MNIVFKHNSILPVRSYGGTERIIYWHMRKLVELGHRVTMIGHKKSHLSPIGVKLINLKKKWESLVPEGTDIIHLYENYKPDIDIPTIRQIQGNGKRGELFPENTVFLTRKHASLHGAQCFIPNALDLREYPFPEGKQCRWEDFLFLAKASWKVKNVKDCIRAARTAKKKLHIVGGRYLWPSRFIRGYGMAGGKRKLALMAPCDALLFPVRWHEPFGIAVVEAMALGLPVLASPYGSLSEIVTGETGLIVDCFAKLVEVMETPHSFNPRTIRTYVEKHFSFDLYSRRFLTLYERVMAGEKLNPSCPTWCGERGALELLAF